MSIGEGPIYVLLILCHMSFISNALSLTCMSCTNIMRYHSKLNFVKLFCLTSVWWCRTNRQLIVKHNLLISYQCPIIVLSVYAKVSHQCPACFFIFSSCHTGRPLIVNHNLLISYQCPAIVLSVYAKVSYQCPACFLLIFDVFLFSHHVTLVDNWLSITIY